MICIYYAPNFEIVGEHIGFSLPLHICILSLKKISYSFEISHGFLIKKIADPYFLSQLSPFVALFKEIQTWSADREGNK